MAVPGLLFQVSNVCTPSALDACLVHGLNIIIQRGNRHKLWTENDDYNVWWLWWLLRSDRSCVIYARAICVLSVKCWGIHTRKHTHIHTHTTQWRAHWWRTGTRAHKKAAGQQQNNKRLEKREREKKTIFELVIEWCECWRALNTTIKSIR